MSAPQAAQKFFDDLLTMEVNLIVKDGMTARKMPASVEAFNDIAEKYENYLGGVDAHFAGEFGTADQREPIDTQREGTGTIWSHPPTEQGEQIPQGEWISARTFRQLAAKAKRLGEDNATVAGPDESDDGLGVVLSRLERNSRILATMLKDPHRKTDADGEENSPADWDPLGKLTHLTKEDLVNLRKAWEVGTEKVVMQTVAQIDGDIVTRVQTERHGTADIPLHDIHRHMVGESLQHWRFLFATVASFTLSVFSSFFGDGD